VAFPVPSTSVATKRSFVDINLPSFGLTLSILLAIAFLALRSAS